MPALGGLLLDNTGVLQCGVGGTIVGWAPGWAPTNTSADGTVRCVFDSGQSRTTVNGLSYDSSGYLIVAIGGTPAGYTSGLALTATGALCVDVTGSGIVGYSAGIAKTSTGAASATGLYLLSILPGGPTAAQCAAGTLTAATGQTITCSRAASGYALGSDGFLHLLGPNTVRVDAAGYGQPAGLLVEQASTNKFLYSPGMSPLAWGGIFSGLGSFTAGSATGPDGVANSAATFVLYAASPATYSVVRHGSVTTTNAVPNTFSIYAKGAVGGEVIYCNVYDGTSYLGTLPQQMTLTTSWQRYSFTVTGTGGLGFVDFGINVGNAGNVAQTSPQTAYLWGPQFEVSPLATSVIATVNAPATRDGDVLRTTTPGSLGVNDAWTYGLDYAHLGTQVGSTLSGQRVCLLGTEVSEVNRRELDLYYGGGASQLDCFYKDSTGGAVSPDVPVTNIAATLTTTYHSYAIHQAASQGNFSGTYDGVTGASFANPNAAQTAVVGTVTIGGHYIGAVCNGHLRNIFISSP